MTKKTQHKEAPDKDELLPTSHRVCRRAGARILSEIESADSRWGVLHRTEQYLIGLPLPLEDTLLQRLKAALNKQRGWLSSYIDGALLCLGPPEAAQAIRKLPGVEWLVGRLQLITWGVLQEAVACKAPCKVSC